jgi:hypothetical protein
VVVGGGARAPLAAWAFAAIGVCGSGEAGSGLCGCSSAPKPTTPTSHRLTPPSKHTGPGWFAIWAINRPICACQVPIFTTFKAIFPRWGSARVAHGPIFVFRTSHCFMAFVLDIPNGFWPLGMAVGRAYVRETHSGVPAFQTCCAVTPLRSGQGCWGLWDQNQTQSPPPQ